MIMISPTVPLCLLCLLLPSLSLCQTDKRCFLEGGWSTISFFVREDLPVNAVIGKIRAIGVVGEDISLRRVRKGFRLESICWD